MNRLAGPLVALLFLAGCGGQNEAERQGQAVIDRARSAHGAAVLDQALVSFVFRGDRYTAERRDGDFEYQRHYTDEQGRAVQDVLSNEGAARFTGGHQVELDERERAALETTVNSVVYFALLPYNLGDPAVRPLHVGVDTVSGRPYDLVEVTFRQEGGGRDWDDRFLYWFDAETAEMDYLAYRFEAGEGGTRFRVATNPRSVGGVRFADYLNYVADPDTARLEAYPVLFDEERLRLVSEIELEDVQVEPLALPRGVTRSDL